MMKRTLFLSVIAVIFTLVSIYFFVWRGGETSDQIGEVAAETKPAVATIAAPGVVEAASEEVEVGAEVPGKLREVTVEEGSRVAKGDIIAVLENEDYDAAVQTARAQIQTLRSSQESARARVVHSQADRMRIANGSRTEERVEAMAAYEQTLPNVENSKIEFERSEKLYRTGDVSREEYDRARTAYETAKRQSMTARERFNLVNASARGDDLAKADAAIRIAESQVRDYDAQINESAARVREAEARLSKTVIRAPIDGVILRKRLKSGESVSPDNQNGIVTIADTSSLRIRVDLDETDVAKIAEGQTAFVSADAFGEQKFLAKVIKIGEIMGRKNFRTERPTEKVDTKILEVLLELAPGQRLPLGLRVDVFISTGDKK